MSLATVLLVATGESDNRPEESAQRLPEVDGPAAPGPPADPSTTESFPDTRTSTEAAEGYEEVSGPGGITTVVPAGWPSAPASGPGAMQADDPADSTRFVRYGGSTAPPEDIYSSHAAYQNQISDRPGFSSIRLELTSFHGADALQWEFEWDAPEGRRHVRSLYWRVDGTEYFVLASALTDRWSETRPILDAMIANAQP